MQILFSDKGGSWSKPGVKEAESIYQEIMGMVSLNYIGYLIVSLAQLLALSISLFFTYVIMLVMVSSMSFSFVFYSYAFSVEWFIRYLSNKKDYQSTLYCFNFNIFFIHCIMSYNMGSTVLEKNKIKVLESILTLKLAVITREL